jgi:hypothetical protein
MGHVATLQQQARARARRRRIELDHDRRVRDGRVEAAAAEAILALGQREDALGQVRAAERRVGLALRRIIAEGVKVDGVARLCDVSVGEVRRLRRSVEAAQEPGGIPDLADPDPAGSPGVSVQAIDDVQTRGRDMDPGHRPPRQPAAAGGPDESSTSSLQVRVTYPRPRFP